MFPVKANRPLAPAPCAESAEKSVLCNTSVCELCGGKGGETLSAAPRALVRPVYMVPMVLNEDERDCWYNMNDTNYKYMSIVD